MYAVGDAYRLHTECIQADKRKKERGIPLLLLLYTACSSIFYCPRFTDNLFTARTFRHVRTHQASLPVLLGHGRRRTQRSWRTASPCDLYALYASKNRLCALCENTTPELTAYNAYRNENRRVRRAEGL